MTEIELKFVIDEAMAGRLWTRAKELKLVNGSRKTRTLRSVYLDTPEYVLKNSGITLRLHALGGAGHRPSRPRPRPSRTAACRRLTSWRARLPGGGCASRRFRTQRSGTI